MQQSFIYRLYRSRVLIPLLAFGGMAVIIYGGARIIQHLRWLAGENNCIGHLSHINLVLKYYHDNHGSYPPLYLRDKEGRPMHSWRVLITKYFETDFYDNYKFTEPWNSPGNLKLASKYQENVVSFFRCPNDHGATDCTSYVAINYSSEEGEESKPVVGGNGKGSSKIALIEVHESGIHWMEPRDLTVDGAISELVLSSKKRPINFLTADSKIGKLFQDSIYFYTPKEALRKRWLFP